MRSSRRRISRSIDPEVVHQLPYCRHARNGVSKCGTASGKCHTLKLCAKRNTSRMLGMDYGLRSAPTIATEITHFSEDRLCQAWRVPF